MESRATTRALIETILFLELSDDSTVQPDSAVAQIEEVAAILREMSTEEREAFIQAVDEMVAEERSRIGNSKRLGALSSLVDDLGIDRDD